MNGEMDGFISRPSRHSSFIDKLIKVLFPSSTLKVEIGETKVLLLI